MNNFDTIANALKSLSNNDKARLGKIMLSMADQYEKDPVSVVLNSIQLIKTEKTDESNKEFMTGYTVINSANRDALLKELCEYFYNTKYIDWLLNYASKYGYVESNNSGYKFYGESDIDKEKINSLNDFYKGVDIYAEENQIPSSKEDMLSCYFVKYQNTILKISASTNHVYGCSIVDSSQSVFIDFNELTKYYSFIKNNDGVQRKK